MATRDFDRYQWWNPFDWFGAHDETSMWREGGIDWEDYQEQERKREIDESLADFRESRERGREETAAFMERQNELLEEQMEMNKEREARLRKRMEDLRGLRGDAIEGLKDRLRESIQNVRAEQAQISQERRDRALGEEEAWKQRAGDLRTRIGLTTTEEQEDLRAAREDLGALRAELREAPSTVAEQARQMQDQQLRQAVAVAQAGGRGVSDMGLRSALSEQGADLISRTAAARSAEHLSRLGAERNIVGQQAGISQAIGLAGMRGIGAETGLSDQEFNVSNLVQSQLDKSFGEQMAIEDMNLRQALGIDQLGLSNALGIESLGATSGISYGNLAATMAGQGLGLGSLGMRGYQLDTTNALSMANFAERQRQQRQAWDDMVEQRERQREAMGFQSLFTLLGGDYLGGKISGALGFGDPGREQQQGGRQGSFGGSQFGSGLGDKFGGGGPLGEGGF